MAVNNIDTLQQGLGVNIPEGNNTEVDGIEILVNMAKQVWVWYAPLILSMKMA